MLCAPSIPPPKSPPRVDGLPIGRIKVLFEVKVKKINIYIFFKHMMQQFISYLGYRSGCCRTPRRFNLFLLPETTHHSESSHWAKYLALHAPWFREMGCKAFFKLRGQTECSLAGLMFICQLLFIGQIRNAKTKNAFTNPQTHLCSNFLI